MTDLEPSPPVALSPGTAFGPSAHPWTPAAALWMVGLTLALSVAGSLGLREVLARDLPDVTTAALSGAILTIGYLIELGVVGAACAARGHSFVATVGLVRPAADSSSTWVAAAIGGALVARAIAAVYSLLVESLGLRLPGAGADPLALFPGGGISALVLLSVVVIIAPFAEEVVFRGVLLPALGARWGTIGAVAVSAIVFAAFHMSVYLFAPILVAAVIFASLAIRYRSLWPSYLAHAAFNGVAVLLVIFLRGRGLA